VGGGVVLGFIGIAYYGLRNMPPILVIYVFYLKKGMCSRAVNQVVVTAQGITYCRSFRCDCVHVLHMYANTHA